MSSKRPLAGCVHQVVTNSGDVFISPVKESFVTEEDKQACVNGKMVTL